MSILKSMAEVVKMARAENKLCYLYKSSAGYLTSFEYWDDWLFKAYPGGRKILSVAGNNLVKNEQRAQQAVSQQPASGGR